MNTTRHVELAVVCYRRYSPLAQRFLESATLHGMFVTGEPILYGQLMKDQGHVTITTWGTHGPPPMELGHVRMSNTYRRDVRSCPPLESKSLPRQIVVKTSGNIER